MTHDLANKYRPQTFKDVLGQREAVRFLTDKLKTKTIPHALLFAGHSGAGKTTLARILRNSLGCGDTDFHELNGADARGIDKVREIIVRLNYYPLGGTCRVWLIDEAHRLTGDAQSALLKPVEEPPEFVYFFFCTTEPKKILRTIRDRCALVSVPPVPRKDLLNLVGKVVEAEGIETTAKVLSSLVNLADGSARQALKLLERLIGVDGEEAQQQRLITSETEKFANYVVGYLMGWEKVTWEEFGAKLKDCDEEPEQLRRLILSVATTVLLKGGKGMKRAAAIIQVFRDDWFSCGKAGLAVSCYDVLGRPQ